MRATRALETAEGGTSYSFIDTYHRDYFDSLFFVSQKSPKRQSNILSTNKHTRRLLFSRFVVDFLTLTML